MIFLFFIDSSKMSRLLFLSSFASILLLTTALNRGILQGTEGCNTSPGTNVPSECSGGSASKNNWSKNDIECHIRNAGYDFKCQYNHETFSANKVQCTLDVGTSQNQLKFECPVYSNCQISCDWSSLESLLPTGAYSSIRLILQSWKPEFEVLGR